MSIVNPASGSMPQACPTLASQLRKRSHTTTVRTRRSVIFTPLIHVKTLITTQLQFIIECRMSRCTISSATLWATFPMATERSFYFIVLFCNSVSINFLVRFKMPWCKYCRVLLELIRVYSLVILGVRIEPPHHNLVWSYKSLHFHNLSWFDLPFSKT